MLGTGGRVTDLFQSHAVTGKTKNGLLRIPVIQLIWNLDRTDPMWNISVSDSYITLLLARSLLKRKANCNGRECTNTKEALSHSEPRFLDLFFFFKRRNTPGRTMRAPPG